MPAMALLDRDGVYGSPRFHLAAQKLGIKAHIGAEITVQSPKESPKSKVQSPKSKKQESSKTDPMFQVPVAGQTLDFELWTLDKQTPEKPFRFQYWSVTARVIKIFADSSR